MSTTIFMDLELPTPSQTIGPLWASEINDAFDLVDAHDHSSGKGVKVKPNGLNINDDLDIQQNELLNVGAVELDALNATLSGALNALKLHSYAGDLYFTNSSGSAVQITSGGSIVSSPGSASIFETTEISTDTTISSSDTFVYLAIDTSSARTITLPLASAVTAGRIYIFKDATGDADTNAITIARAGSDTIDGETSFVHDIEYGAFILVSDGASKWYVS